MDWVSSEIVTYVTLSVKVRIANLEPVRTPSYGTEEANSQSVLHVCYGDPETHLNFAAFSRD
jgi:hypothetical protein